MARKKRVEVVQVKLNRETDPEFALALDSLKRKTRWTNSKLLRHAIISLFKSNSDEREREILRWTESIDRKYKEIEELKLLVRVAKLEVSDDS